MTSRTFRATLVREGSGCFIRVPFDPREVFGKVRAPVVVALPGHSYRSTIASMGDGPCIPLRKSHRDAAGLRGDETVEVTLTLDEAPREVEVPDDLHRALTAVPGGQSRWSALSYTHQREHVEAIEAAKKPETRSRRIAAAVRMVIDGPNGPTRR